MLKRINWKLVFKCFAWTVCLGGVITLMSFVEVKKHTLTCTKVKILIPGADNFIEREEIDAILKQSEGVLKGRNLANINLQDMERRIIANPYIADAKVYADMEGVIHIEISQRQPLLRVINSGGQDYYIDRDGLKMPVSPNFTADVVVANGKIMEHFGGKVDTLITKVAADLYRTALFLKKDTLWDAQIEQIFVTDKDDIELVPRVGNQRIILGSADSLEKKMTNLLIFYKKAMPLVGWDTYKTINIKYTNQIVCERNKIDSLNGEPIRTATVEYSALKSKKVIDSLVSAQIAEELKINPEEKEERVVPVVRAVTVPAKKIVAEKKSSPEKKAAVVKKTAPLKKAVVDKKAEPLKNKVEIVPKKPVAKQTVAKKAEETKKVAATVKKEDVKKTVVKQKEIVKETAKPKLPEGQTPRKSWPPQPKGTATTKKPATASAIK